MNPILALPIIAAPLLLTNCSQYATDTAIKLPLRTGIEVNGVSAAVSQDD